MSPLVSRVASPSYGSALALQRPLEDIANREGSVFVPRGVDVPCLDQDKDWEFKPCNFREGQVCTCVDLCVCVRLYVCGVACVIVGCISMRWHGIGQNY